MPSRDFLPDFLKPFVATQDPSLYTAIDHASWRFIIKISQRFFSKTAHQKYLDGLKETGISTERIPLIEEMDVCLKKFGWRAVAISGFIPPTVFMEFQSLGILPIACEMRTLDHLAYTPAPDIVHEAAGHAPIIASPDFAMYLKQYGEIARKAIFSSQDQNVYEAVRELSDIKENPASTPADIERVQKELDKNLEAVTYVSEATQLSRMGWWTFEYGLVGPIDNPKIYGAGLLSSVGESYNCLKPEVKKIPLTIDCINTSFDITKPQPQLFVTPDFEHATKLLHEFANLMAFKRGGVEGLAKAKQAQTVCTIVLDSGVQISGKLVEYRADTKNKAYYLKCDGPTQIAYNDIEIEGQGPEYHHHGFSTIIGTIKGSDKSPAELSDSEIKNLKSFEFESGVKISGIPQKIIRKDSRAVIIRFDNCTITHNNETLYKPEWGTFDLACGKSITSVFGGAADRNLYISKTGGLKQKPQVPKCNLTPENKDLSELYAQVRKLRESKVKNITDELSRIESSLESQYPQDWLLRLELLELNKMHDLNAHWINRVQSRLDQIAKTRKDKAEMIERGREVFV